MGYTKDQLLSDLQKLEISFSKYEHPVVLTVEAQASYLGNIKSALSKNLFLKDKKQRFYIVSALADTKVDLKVLSQRLGLGKGGIRMAPEESLAPILQVPLGCVTPFALVNESARNVSLLLDQGFKSRDSCIFHPLSNDMSIALNPQDLDKFFKSIEIVPAYVDLETNPAVGKDQPPDLASLVPSDATVLQVPQASVQVPKEKQISSNINPSPVAKAAETAKPFSASTSGKSSGASNPSITFADTDKFVDEILEKTKSIALSQVEGKNVEKYITRLGLELKNIATMFKNTAYTEGFMAGKMAVCSKLQL